MFVFILIHLGCKRFNVALCCRFRGVNFGVYFDSYYAVAFLLGLNAVKKKLTDCHAMPLHFGSVSIL